LAVCLAAATAQPAAAEARFGVMTDVGVPDGANASVVYRPLRPLRLNAGGGYNMISKGVRAGATWVPFGSWVTPTLSFDVGHYFDGDANPLARMVSGDPEFHSDTLERIGYSYANAHVGVEFGRKWFTFYIHAGMSRISGDIKNLNEEIGDDSSVMFSDDPHVTTTVVSARLGFVVYFLK
jgi:hypothetical protein